jgi:repressor LexA
MAKSAKPGNSDNVHEIPDGPPDAAGLTPRQHRVLDVIRDSVERRG